MYCRARRTTRENSSHLTSTKKKYMKRSNVYVSGLILAGSTFLFSCEKTDISADVQTELSKKKPDACELVAFRYNMVSPTGSLNQYVFQKQNDPVTGKLKQI